MIRTTILTGILESLEINAADHDDFTIFRAIVNKHGNTIYGLYSELYEGHIHFYSGLESLFKIMWDAFRTRKSALRKRDRETSLWFLDNAIVGGVIYTDLFSENLEKLSGKIPYLEKLGINYLHLMPLYARPDKHNDGGYAVSDYGKIKTDLGTIEELSGFADTLHKRGMYLVLDFILNHVSEEHIWAVEARKNTKSFREFFYIFSDETDKNEYQRCLRDIFPTVRKGSFTWNSELAAWVWTTFHSYQWDLNYSNPAVFAAMAGEMLSLANLGADVLRFDALAFIWKEKGTSCENLPGAHTLIRAFKAVCKAVAPSVCFKSEAIVHPDQVKDYIGPTECELSYNPLLMALSWETLATRETRLLYNSVKPRFQLGNGCSWINYVRCHDDIGWTFSDEDAGLLGINAYDHRRFLNSFYTGRFPGSFARGLPFQENPDTGDVRIAGTCASLAGLEKAMAEETSVEVDLAVKRILLLYNIAFTIGGIPLIYLGDELAVLNNYGFTENPSWKDDSRWVHRIPTEWDAAQNAAAGKLDPESPEARIFAGICRLSGLRSSISVFKGNRTEFPEPVNPHLFIYKRLHGSEWVLVLANFSEHVFAIDAVDVPGLDKNKNYIDLYNRNIISGRINFGSYQVLWLKNEEN